MSKDGMICIDCGCDESEHMLSADRICNHPDECRGFDDGLSNPIPEPSVDALLDLLGERYIMVEHRLINNGMPEENGKRKELKSLKSQLRDLLLSSLPDGNSIVQPDLSEIPDNGHWIYFKGQRYAIDQVTKKINQLFGGMEK